MQPIGDAAPSILLPALGRQMTLNSRTSASVVRVMTPGIFRGCASVSDQFGWAKVARLTR
jgi:hypothetical protein